MYIFMCVYIFVCVCVYIYIYPHICIYIYVCIYTYTHTHMHIYPLERGMATHSSILAWGNPMDRDDWQATVHGVAKSQTLLKQVSTLHIYMCVCVCIDIDGASLVAQLVKNPPALQETPVRFLGWGDPLEKG